MQSVIETTLAKALTYLNAIGAKYKVIMPDGTEHGVLEVVVPKVQKRRPSTHPRGTLTGIYVPLLQNLAVGEVAVIPETAGIEPNHMRAAIASYASKEWGNGSARTCITNGQVEVLRVS